MEQNIINSLKRLERVGDENSKVTQKLRTACKEITEIITDIVNKTIRNSDETVKLPRGYKVKTVHYNNGQFDFDLFIGSISPVNSAYSYGYHPGGDFNVYVSGVKREQCLQFAKDIAEGLLEEISDFIENETKAAIDAEKEIDQAICQYIETKKR